MDLDLVESLLREKNYDALGQALVKNSDFIESTEFKRRFLSWIMRSGDLNLIRRLVLSTHSNGSKIDVLCAWIRTSWDEEPSSEIFRIIIASKIEFPDSSDLGSCRDIMYSLQYLIRGDYLKQFNALIKAGLDLVSLEKIVQRSLLNLGLQVVLSEKNRVLIRAVDLGCSLIPMENDHDKSNFKKALENRQFGLIKKILEYDRSTICDDVSVVLANVKKIPSELVHDILKDQDVNLLDSDKNSASCMACFHDNSEYLKILISHGADISLNGKYSTPLINSIENMSQECMNILLKNGADVNVLSKGKTALDVALSMPGSKKVCSLLKNNGAKCADELRGERPETLAINESKRILDSGEAWSDQALKDLVSGTLREISAWNELLRHCLENSSNKPSKKWMSKASEIASDVGFLKVRESLISWFSLVGNNRTGDIREVTHKYDHIYAPMNHVFSDNNAAVLKGLLWLSHQFSDSQFAKVLRTVASQMYKKIYGVGMRSGKLGTAAVTSLSMMPGDVGIKEIIHLRSSTKYSTALDAINRVFNRIAEERGVPVDELSAIAPDDYGLEDIGIYRNTIGNANVSVTMAVSGKASVQWNLDGKVTKTVPAIIRSNKKSEVKNLRERVKELEYASRAQINRLESLYSTLSDFDYPDWKINFLDHPLVGIFARSLVWHFSYGNSFVDAIYHEGKFYGVDGRSVSIDESSRVSLWHPIMSELVVIEQWRQLLFSLEITQAFKQVHREMYIPTQAELATRTYSNRYLNHLLKQSQLHELCQQRGWKQTRGGSWDGGQYCSAVKKYDQFDISVELNLTGADKYGNEISGIYSVVVSGKLDFFRNEKPLKIADINVLLFSELMRDIDLFVAVSSIGNDPEWDSTDSDWYESSFGRLSEIGETRKQVLEGIIKKLNKSDLFELRGNFLHVRGFLTSYKIHIGSSNVLMEPGDLYLCLVESTAKKSPSVFLPFEGDRILSLVLSKALILSSDNKIKDEVIMSQIQTAVRSVS